MFSFAVFFVCPLPIEKSPALSILTVGAPHSALHVEVELPDAREARDVELLGWRGEGSVLQSEPLVLF